MGNDFVFRSNNLIGVPARTEVPCVTFAQGEFFDLVRTPRHDTHSISFMELNYNLDSINGIQNEGQPNEWMALGGERSLTYAQHEAGCNPTDCVCTTGTPFASIVNMQPGQNRFFLIIESDEAGNTIQYNVNLRIDYEEVIQAGNLRRGRESEGNLLTSAGSIYGTNISILSVDYFLQQNRHFHISVTSGGIVRTIVRGDDTGRVHTVNMNNHISLTEALRFALQPANMPTGRATIRLDVGSGAREIEVFQITTGTQEIMLSATATLPVNVRLTIENFEQQPALFRNYELINEILVWDMVASEELDVPVRIGGSYGDSMILEVDGRPGLRFSDLLITVIDNFGREAHVEWHGLSREQSEFNPLGGVTDGIQMFTGAPQGIEVKFNEDLHTIQFFRDGIEVNADQHNITILPTTGISRLSTVIITPPLDNIQTHWEVILTSNAMRDVRGVRYVNMQREWIFYTNLPELTFRTLNNVDFTYNVNETTMDFASDRVPTLAEIETARAGGIIQVIDGIVQIGLELVPSLFDYSITYTRYHPSLQNPQTTPVAPGRTRFFITQEGTFHIRVTNTAHALRTWTFHVRQTDNTTYRVYFRDENPNFHPGLPLSDLNSPYMSIENRRQLEESPVPFETHGISELSFLWGRPIPSYFVVANPWVLDNQGPEGRLQIVPSINYPRIVLPTTITPDDSPNTRIFILRSELTGPPLSVLTPSPDDVFIAVTAIPSQDPNTPSTDLRTHVSLQVPRGEAEHNSPNIANQIGSFRLFTNVPAGGLAVRLGLNNPSVNFNFHRGNIFFIDYYLNGEYVGRVLALPGEQIVIRSHNYGTFTFRVSDWAGNVMTFTGMEGAGMTEDGTPPPPGSTEPVTRNAFTLVNLARPPIFVNDMEVVDGMVVNDRLVISSRAIPFSARNMNFNFVYAMTVYRNNERLPEPWSFTGTPAWRHSDTSWEFTQPGMYRIYIRYAHTASTIVTKNFRVQLVSSTRGVDSFFFGGAANITIESIRRNGAEMSHTFGQGVLRNFTLDHSTGVGIYIVTARIDADGIRDSHIRTFTVVIHNLPSVRDINGVRVNGVRFGSSTTNSVYVVVNPRMLYMFFNDVTLRITRDGQPAFNIPISGDSVSWDVSFRMPGEGRYSVTVVNAHNQVIFADGFRMTEGTNIWGILLIIIGAGVVFAGVFVFFLIRNRMRVK